MAKIYEEKKMTIIPAELKKYCKYCKHSVFFPKTSRKDKIICSYCGHYIYKSDKIEFLEKIKQAENKQNSI